MVKRLAIMLALAGAASVGAWQTPQVNLPEGTGSIRGQVIDATSGAPIANATVTVSQYPLGSRSVQADAAGEFVIDRLPAATLSLGARQARQGNFSYSGGRYGQRSADSAEQPFELADGEHATGVELRLWRSAVISGRVTDAKGAAIPGVTVQAMRLSSVNGVRTLRSSNSSRTDVTGRYRISQIWPGTYGVSIAATAADGYYLGGGASAAFAGYPTTFYPAASSAEGASLFHVNAGEEREGVDFTLTTGSLVSVAGTVEGLPVGARSPVVELCSVDLVVAKAVVGSEAASGSREYRPVPMSFAPWSSPRWNGCLAPGG